VLETTRRTSREKWLVPARRAWSICRGECTVAVGGRRSTVSEDAPGTNNSCPGGAGRFMQGCVLAADPGARGMGPPKGSMVPFAAYI